MERESLVTTRIRYLGGIAVLLAATLSASAAQATESGSPITSFGVFEFGAGMMPPPTPLGTFATRFAYYSSGTLKDAGGHTVPNRFDLNVASLSVVYLRMTNLKFIGANVGYQVVVPFMYMHGSLTAATPAGPLHLSSSTTNLGDAQVLPVILQWSTRNFFANAAIQIQAPTGSYSKTRLVNPGNNHWTISPEFGMTYLTESGFEISTHIEINQNTTNHATGYRSGTEYTQEFAIGQHFGPVTAGLGGYVYRQLSDDHGADVIDGNRAKVNALGPAFSFFRPGLPSVWLHLYKEFGAENRSQGYQVALRLAMSF
ncbi:transporter [Burkholderia cepacia]|uniref:SphA family protein n=1 Tax=Burkholderia cepacia TaxID=292 RepID=UPI00075C5D88|nr:transporter [Burkholderia cepacia]KVU63094.1 hypothetical protein WK70_04420 [Burkholderia cepacia]